jgi:acetyltransferase-like isoleucine patch superfamily enzyme
MLAVAGLPAFTCWLESVLTSSEFVFLTWTHVFAILPGQPGMYLRRAFYYLTLESCSLDTFIGFMATVTHRDVVIEPGVYVGPFAVIGSVQLRTGSLVGTRASLLSGSLQHVMGEDGTWKSTDRSSFERIEIGPHAWIGEAATVMASVGPQSAVAAGAVVAAPVSDGIVVGGNPARFVRSVEIPRRHPLQVEAHEDEPLVPSVH